MAGARAPAARVGMVGGGQLARMTHQAAIALGIELTVLADDPAAPAATAGAVLHQGPADDPAALRALAAGSDVLSFDHEQVPIAAIEAIADAGHAVQPPPSATALAQDKLLARLTLGELGFPVPRFASVRSGGEVARFGCDAGWPVVLKARRGGYDGRGVRIARDVAEADEAIAAWGGHAVAEERVDIEFELAVQVARRASGEARTYPVVQTVQEDGMCREMIAPAPVDADVAKRARDLATRIAATIGATGVVAVELFVARDGRVLVNELALRPHNSGHWTIEGCATSQFEQHLRAVLDWPLGSTALRAEAVATVNVVGGGGGDPRARVPAALSVDGVHVHLYGKAPREGRKLGHVTALGQDVDFALAAAREAAACLEGR